METVYFASYAQGMRKLRENLLLYCPAAIDPGGEEHKEQQTVLIRA